MWDFLQSTKSKTYRSNNHGSLFVAGFTLCLSGKKWYSRVWEIEVAGCD
jgi:hypothetical protein